MTLSNFLRNFLYIPMGGNRKGPVRRYVNLAATMLLGGLWHGASWNFVFWGLLHGFYLSVNHAWSTFVNRGQEITILTSRGQSVSCPKPDPVIGDGGMGIFSSGNLYRGWRHAGGHVWYIK